MGDLSPACKIFIERPAYDTQFSDTQFVLVRISPLVPSQRKILKIILRKDWDIFRILFGVVLMLTSPECCLLVRVYVLFSAVIPRDKFLKADKILLSSLIAPKSLKNLHTSLYV